MLTVPLVAVTNITAPLY